MSPCSRRIAYQKRPSSQPNKLEAIVTGTRQQIAKLPQTDGDAISGVAISFGSTLWVLEVSLGSELTFDEHIAVLVRAWIEVLFFAWPFDV